MPKKDYVVIDEIYTTKGQLMKNLTKKERFAIIGKKFAVKFSLTGSFKTKTNYVVDNFKVEICAIDINGEYKETEIKDRVKVVKQEVQKIIDPIDEGYIKEKEVEEI